MYSQTKGREASESPRVRQQPRVPTLDSRRWQPWGTLPPPWPSPTGPEAALPEPEGRRGRASWGLPASGLGGSEHGPGRQLVPRLPAPRPLLPMDRRLQRVPGSSWNSSLGINTQQKGGAPGGLATAAVSLPALLQADTQRALCPLSRGPAARPAFPRPQATGHSRVLQQHLT